MENEEGPKKKKKEIWQEYQGLRRDSEGWGHLWTCSIRDPQGRRGDVVQSPQGSVAGKAWHGIEIHKLNIVL